MIKKINLYVFIQLIKSCILIFFIFTSIGWLLQISRLFSYLNIYQIKMFDILYLSLFLLPNLVNVIIPFIIIFGVVITFIKMDRDKEIIAIYSLGLNINVIKNPLYCLLGVTTILYIFLNFFFSPYIYGKYKENEFELRNSVDLNNINYSNFIKLEKIILDFDKEDDVYKNIYINFIEEIDETENIIYAKKGSIESNKNEFLFTLVEGYKLSLYESKIEKLEFEKYKITFPNNSINVYNNHDKNTETLNDLIKNNKYQVLSERLFDIIILISIIIYFYFKNIKYNNFKINNIIQFLIIAIIILIIQNLIKNININYLNFLILNILNIFILIFLSAISKIRLK